MTPIERLRRLLFVATNIIDESRFNMRKFGTPPQGALPGDVLVDCGTAGCLAGWAATDPVLREEGLMLRVDDLGRAQPEYRGDHGQSALEAFFLGPFPPRRGDSCRFYLQELFYGGQHPSLGKKCTELRALISVCENRARWEQTYTPNPT